jgi:pimeloyl-ACP methyl ester carboxylesterase
VLDAARAARQLDGAGAGGRVVLAGHSEGGHAVLWAAELATSYAPELQVTGVAALAPAPTCPPWCGWPPPASRPPSPPR